MATSEEGYEALRQALLQAVEDGDGEEANRLSDLWFEARANRVHDFAIAGVDARRAVVEAQTERGQVWIKEHFPHLKTIKFTIARNQHQAFLRFANEAGLSVDFVGAPERH